MPMEGIWLWDSDAAAWVKGKADSSGRIYVVEDHDGLAPVRLTATGLVQTGATELHWISITPSAGNSVVELSDDLDGSSAILWEHFDTDRHSDHINIEPPMLFSTGLYLKTFTNMTAVTFGLE